MADAYAAVARIIERIRTADFDTIRGAATEDIFVAAVSLAYFARAHNNMKSPADVLRALLEAGAFPEGEDWDDFYASIVETLARLPE